VSPQAWKPPLCFLSPWVWLLQVPDTKGIIPYFPFCDWVDSLSIRMGFKAHCPKRCHRGILNLLSWRNLRNSIAGGSVLHCPEAGHRRTLIWELQSYPVLSFQDTREIPKEQVGCFSTMLLSAHILISSPSTKVSPHQSSIKHRSLTSALGVHFLKLNTYLCFLMLFCFVLFFVTGAPAKNSEG
jgi:hypothetical protein